METTSPRFNSNAASIFQFSPPCGKRASARAKKRAYVSPASAAPCDVRRARTVLGVGRTGEKYARRQRRRHRKCPTVLRHPRDSVHPDFYTARAVRDIPFKTPRKIGALHRRRSISHAGKADIMLGRAPQKQKRRLRPPRGGFLPAVKRSPRPHEVPRRDCRKFTEKFFRII